MLKGILVLMVSIGLISVTHAGQVLMSCDIAGIHGVDEIHIKETYKGLVVNIFMEGNGNTPYSLPLTSKFDTSFVDLGGFNVFNDFADTQLAKHNGQWFFVTDGVGHAVSCVELRNN